MAETSKTEILYKMSDHEKSDHDQHKYNMRLTMPSQTMNDQHTFNTKILNKKLFWLDFTLIWKISYFLKWVLMNHPNIVALLWKKITEWFKKQHWPSNAHISQYLNCTDYQYNGKW